MDSGSAGGPSTSMAAMLPPWSAPSVDGVPVPLGSQANPGLGKSLRMSGADLFRAASESCSDVDVEAMLSEDPSNRQVSEAAVEFLANSPAYNVTRDKSPAGPHILQILRTDATSSPWPKEGPFQDTTGSICEWKAINETDPLGQRWLTALGHYVAGRLGIIRDNKEVWTLSQFPDGYKLFKHVKRSREDTYLFGSKRVLKFRTANEFSPHCAWLVGSQVDCRCKYCTGGKSQHKVNVAVGITLRHTSATPTKTPQKPSVAISDRRSSAKHRRDTVDSPNVNASRSRAKLLDLDTVRTVSTQPVQEVYTGPYASVDQSRDLERTKCRFRRGEMVWCRLPNSFASVDQPSLKIDYWPSVCMERLLDIQTKKRSADGEIKEEFDIANLSVIQTYKWKMRLLATSTTLVLTEEDLLPWLLFPPPPAIFQVPLSEPLPHVEDGHKSERPRITDMTDLSSAIVAYALACQIARHVVSFWNLHDLYRSEKSKKGAIDKSSRSTTPQPKTQTSSYFQGIWWGAEKIWLGEFVRLRSNLNQQPAETTIFQIPECHFLEVQRIYRDSNGRAKVKGDLYKLVASNAEEVDELQESPLPINSPRYIPSAPTGFTFQNCTPKGKELHFDVGHIAGRYYSHQSLTESYQPLMDENIRLSNRAQVLSNLTTQNDLYMNCSKWIQDRKETLKQSEWKAESELRRHFKKCNDSL